MKQALALVVESPPARIGRPSRGVAGILVRRAQFLPGGADRRAAQDWSQPAPLIQRWCTRRVPGDDVIWMAGVRRPVKTHANDRPALTRRG